MKQKKITTIFVFYLIFITNIRCQSVNIDFNKELKNLSNEIESLLEKKLYSEINKIKIKYLKLTENVDVNYKNSEGKTPLHIFSNYSCYVGRNITNFKFDDERPFLDSLRFHSSQVSDPGTTSSFSFSSHDDELATQCIKILINKGIDINVKDNEGNTPLILAIDSNHISIASFLLKNSANVNAKNEKGQNSLHLLCSNMNFKNTVADMLIENGLDINAQDNAGKTILHCALENFFAKNEMINYLINKDANLNIKDEDGNTPLHIAVYEDKNEFVEILITKSDLSIKNNKGLTAFQLAKNKKRNKIIKIFESYLNKANS